MVLGVAALTAYYFLEIAQKESKSIVQVLPETSLATIHFNGFTDAVEEWEAFEYFDQLPEADQLLAFKDKLDSLKTTGDIPNTLLNLEMWLSVHSNGSDGLNTLFIAKSKNFNWNTESVIKLFELMAGGSYSEDIQVFNDQEIHILKSEQGVFNYGIGGDFLFWSTEAVLIEDVFRAIGDENARLLNNVGLSKKELNKPFYLNGNRLNELSRVFVQNADQVLGNTGLVYMLDLDDLTNQFSFSGSGIGSISWTANESTLFAKNFISSESSFSKWVPIPLKEDNDLSSAILPQSLSIGLESGETVRILDLVDTSKVITALYAVAERNLSLADSLVYSEEFMFTKIGYIGEETYLSSLSSDFTEKSFYYTVFQNYWLLSESVDALKRVLIDFDEERTLGRDVSARSEIDDLVQETSYTLLKNFNYSEELLIQSLRPKWQEYLNGDSQLNSLLSMFTLQVNNTGKQSLVSGKLTFNQPRKVIDEAISVEDVSAEVISNVFADNDLTTKPFVVRNHVNAQLEVIFQDAGNQLYLSDLQGEVKWKRSIDGQVKGSIKQIDFYNNKKLQYLMVTDSLLHLIDRNGNNVEGFPVAYTSKQEIKDLAVIDYDNSKRYRYLLLGVFGDLYLMNKEGQMLEGWNPKSLGNQLQETPFHTRVRGRDAFVAIDYLGNFELLNRRAESYRGFPVNTGLRLSGDVFLNKGPNFETTSMTLLGKDGMLQTVNFSGKTLNKQQLFKPDTQTNFELLADVSGSTFRILQSSNDRSYILDNKGERLFEMEEPSDDLEITFYNFRNGNGVYAVRNTLNNSLKLVNERGEVISGSIDCDEPPSILFFQSSQQYQVFVNFTNQLTQYAIDVR